MTQFHLTVFATFILTFASAALPANTVTTITPRSNQVMLVNGKATVTFVVSGQGNEDSDCGIWIDYGDGDSPDTRVVGRRDGVFPREFSHTFNRAGQFSVVARGQRVKQTFGCSGSASTSVTILDAPASRRRGSLTTACPDGWQLREGSHNRQTGAFTCVAAFPAQPIDCGRGLRYFERDNTIGCRAVGQR